MTTYERPTRVRSFTASIVRADAAASTVLVRLLVGGVFLSEGVQKFLFPDALGVGRFMKVGIPLPAFAAPFVGVVEVVGGAFVILGLFTRIAAVPLVVDMLVAIATTKVPILLERGFWAMVHEARVDYAMLLGSVFLLLAGSGRLSLDARVGRPKARDG